MGVNDGNERVTSFIFLRLVSLTSLVSLTRMNETRRYLNERWNQKIDNLLPSVTPVRYGYAKRNEGWNG